MDSKAEVSEELLQQGAVVGTVSCKALSVGCQHGRDVGVTRRGSSFRMFLLLLHGGA